MPNKEAAMSQAIRFRPQVELAGTVKVDVRRVRHPHYGRYLEEFAPGQVFVLSLIHI